LTKSKNCVNIDQKEIAVMKQRIKYSFFIGCFFINLIPAFSQIDSHDFISLTINSNYKVNKMYLDGHLSPIGWSQGGYIAFARWIRWIPNGGPANICSVEIFDTITDKSVDLFRIEYSEDNDLSFEEFWSINKEGVTNFLRRYNIVSFPDIEIQPINQLKNQYGLEVIFEDTVDEYGSPWYTNIIVLNSHGRRKAVSTIGLYGGAEILGFYKSPYENRVVLYIKEIAGGPLMGEIFYYFVGCHLSVGFQ
jgi:hypothetical protein